jgi:hypothetical protein
MDPFDRKWPQTGPNYDMPSSAFFSQSQRSPPIPPSYDNRLFHQPNPTINNNPTRNDIRKITPPDNVEGEKNSSVLHSTDPYNEARDFITGFNRWHSGTRTLPNSDIYEENFAIQMSMKEWMRLYNDLNLLESDDKSAFLLQNYFCLTKQFD